VAALGLASRICRTPSTRRAIEGIDKASYINPTLYPNAGYDPRKDFAPIGLIGWQPSVLTVGLAAPAGTSAAIVDRLAEPLKLM
jgi:tripartite-type tricarboxylate transporter receptor subunit TctC